MLRLQDTENEGFVGTTTSASGLDRTKGWLFQSLATIGRRQKTGGESSEKWPTLGARTAIKARQITTMLLVSTREI